MGTVNGVPAHILFVHAIVVLLPLSALLLVLSAAWPRARQRFAGPNAVLSILVLVLVPITTSAGEWLERRVPGSGLLHDHAELGDTTILAALPITVLAVIVWWRHRESLAVEAATPRRAFLAPGSAKVTGVVTALAVILGVFATYHTYRVGDSGAKAAWTDGFSATPTQDGTDKPPGR